MNSAIINGAFGRKITQLEIFNDFLSNFLIDDTTFR